MRLALTPKISPVSLALAKIRRAPRWLKPSLGFFLLGCVLIFAIRTLHWPLVNDPAQLDYACFLRDHGMAPYRDLIEINMPGIYLINWTVMHTLGGGPLAWRFFDWLLMAAISAAMISIAWPYDWFAGALGAALFILFHGHDGAGQTGQRDFIIAVFLVGAYAFLISALRSKRALPFFFAGLLGGVAVAIKPTPLPFLALALLVALLRCRKTGMGLLRPLVYSLEGFTVFPAAAVLFLLSTHSFMAFISVGRHVLPYYSELGRMGFGELVSSASTSSVRALALLGCLAALLTRAKWNWEGAMLLLGVMTGLGSLLEQGRGFTYHRYPLLAFLFLWGSLQLLAAVRSRGGWVWALGAGGIAFALVLAPLYTIRASRRHWNPEFIKALTADLNQLGGPSLSGHVQCIYTPADCDTVLYRMKLVQSTGLFYDYLIFDNAKGRAQPAVIQQSRARFWRQLQRHPDDVLIVGAGLYPNDPDSYNKLKSWPQLAEYINDNFTLYSQRKFDPGEPGPLAYRIYLRKPERAIAALKMQSGFMDLSALQ